MNGSGPLTCDACRAAPGVSNEELLAAAFEAHHLQPLALSGEKVTRVSDMTLLCANCHRLIHRAMHMWRRWVGIAELRILLKLAPPPSPGS